MQQKLEFRIGDRLVGVDHPCYVIAEAGVNHRCKMDLALQMVREAKQAGADAIKFQTYKADTLVTRTAPRYWEDAEPSGTQFAIFRQSDHFGDGEYRRLAEECAASGIDFLSTPFDLGAVDFLDSLGMPVFKVASADLTNTALLKRIVEKNKPVLQSTGASTLDEVREHALRSRAAGARDLALLHCVLCYPTATEDANLRRISLLREQFPDCLIGYSDHTDATVSREVAVAAVTLGACIIEKHFTLDRSWPGDDHYHSADPAYWADMMQSIRTVERALGRAYDGILPCEEKSRRFARRSIVAARNIRAGERITEEMLIMKRPGTGISPTEMGKVVGRAAVREVAEDAMLTWDDLAK